MYKERKSRSLLKTVSWRVLATCTTAFIVFCLTGKLLLAVSVGAVEATAKMILYFFHERAWDKIRYGRKTVEPFVLWFTGLSGAGKSTLADKVFKYIKKKGCRVECLDGDSIRAVFPKTGFTKKDRDDHVKRVGHLASVLERNGIIVISSFVSPYAETRGFVRGLCQNFKEVYVKASVETCEQRDVKGLYAKARAGEIEHFTGVNDPYEAPENPEILIDTNTQDTQESFSILKGQIDKWLS